jgi:hypothetical protein
VEPSGAVALPTLDDLALARSPAGACVKAAAGRMSFAPFEGAPVRLDVPLSPPGGR